MALETGLGWEGGGGKGPSWGCQGFRDGSDLGARSLREQRWCRWTGRGKDKSKQNKAGRKRTEMERECQVQRKYSMSGEI